MKTKLNQGGFTLIEVMFSVAILALVLLAAFSALTEAHKMSQESRYRLIATNAARSVLETVKETPLALVGVINTNNFIPTDLPNGAIAITTNPANLTGVQLATITVSITWTNPKGLPGVLEFTTMRSRF